jgi:NADH-quinone oxidoreductase subunit J
MVAADLLIAQNIAFGILALLMVVSAVRVVTVNNVVHAAFWLVLVLSGAAGQYLLATAEFVGIAQILVYIGAVMVLFLFGTMLTRARVGAESDLNTPRAARIAVPSAVVLLGVMTWVLIDGFGDTRVVEDPADVQPIGVAPISDAIFGPYLLPFWALAFLLLIAVIGAIVLARKD